MSPDGRTLAFARGPARLTADELVLRDLESGAERVILAAPGVAAPDWAPDGSRIAVALGGAIVTIHTDGTGLRTLVTGGTTEPAWSPDGTRIAFERDGDIWTMTPAGGELVNITRSPPRGA